MVSVQGRTHNLISKKIISILKPDKFIVLSNKQASYYNKLGFKCIVSPIGVASEKYTEATLAEKKTLREKLGLPVSDKIVLHVGHINKGRNLEILSGLVLKGFKIIVIASTRFESDLKLKSELEQKGFVFVSNYIENIEHYYQASDVYVFPVLSAVSAMEFPMSVLEAMSCNIPVLTTKFGGIESFLSETEWFKYFSNEEELLNKIDAFPSNAVCTNRQLMLSKFSWQNVFDALFANNNLV
jgi:glycosyltransferase involved in cell wall biosynthesis